MEVFECSTCAKVLKSKKALIVHLKKQTCSQNNLEKTYKCRFSDCRRQFSSVNGRLYHEKKIHNKPAVRRSLFSTNSKLVKCYFCPATFLTRNGRLRHSRKLHVDQQLPTNPKKIFDCFHCHKSFTKKSNCLRHEASCKQRKNSLVVMVHNSAENVSERDPDAPANVIPPDLDTSANVIPPDSDTSANIIPLDPDTSANVMLPTGCNVSVTPTLQCYLRDRKPFMLLRTPDFATPRRSKINLWYGKKTVKQYRNKVSTLQQRIRRLQKKVESLGDLIKHLEKENEISPTLADTFLNDLPNSCLQMALRMQSGRKNMYNEEIRKFALTLNFYSAKAYRYVRKTWKNLLPAPSTLRTWYSKLNGEPGFCEESMSALRAKVAHSSPAYVLCNFVMDEIDIRKELTFRNNKYHGYVELGLGSPSDSDNQPLAVKALVFMLVCLNGRWKLPVGYFFIDSINGENLCQLVKTALQLVDDCGVIVRSMTFDGAKTNLTCCKILGANFTIGPDFRPWFPHPCHPNERVYLFLDPSHALKLVRNTFGDFTITDSLQRPISFFDIKNLHYLQQERGLSSAPKLTKRHICWRENKMRVKLAAQVLSSSVSSALLHAQKKGLPEFKSSEGTAEFCKQFDQNFDMLNCRTQFNQTRKPHSVPVRTSNIEKFQTWYQEAAEYIRNLTISGVPVLNHSRKTGFLGFLFDIQNLIPLFECLRNYGLEYLLSYKLSQDHLEVWFSAVRAKGGCNNNPNAEQFKAIFKRLLVHHELQTSDNANCSSSDINILQVTSSSGPEEDTVLSNAAFQQLDDEEAVLRSLFDEFITVDEALLEEPLDNYERDVVAYIAGFIVRKLQKKFDLKPEETKDLADNKNTSDLITLKSRGKLIFPTGTVVRLCEVIEKKIRGKESRLLNPNNSEAQNEILADIEESENFRYLGRYIEIIVKTYLKIRIHHLCKKISEVDKNIRHSSTKNIIFKHQ